MARRFFNSTIQQMEAVFAQQSQDIRVLGELAEELKHRNTERGTRLRAAVDSQIQKISAGTSPKLAVPAPPPPVVRPILGQGPEIEPVVQPPISHPGKPNSSQDQDSPLGPTTALKPVPPITNTPEQILSAWTALEVLSPPSFRRPEDLASGDRGAIAALGEEMLPWERGEKARPNCRLYYQVVLGSMKMEPAIEQLVRRFGDTRPERPESRGSAVLAVVIVDKQGRLVQSPAVAVSSFGWGVMTALRGDLSHLAGWPRVESEMIRCIETSLLALSEGESKDEARARSISRAGLQAAYDLLLAQTGLPYDWVAPPQFAVRSYEYFRSSNPPQPLLLNSFFLADLSVARALFESGRAPANLKRYVRETKPRAPRDLFDDRVLDEALAPAATNLSRWPAPGRHPLVLLQQAAVNLAFSETRNGGMLGVNGPPGTGKTTLLRDIIAGVVTARAEAMSQFDDPETAFTHSGEKLRAGEGWIHLYRLDAKLRGFEMVVASSNNKAVENVSAELPAIGSIAADASELRYFKLLADELHQCETWGMIAAVLGNTRNLARFKQTFWWDEDLGMSAYLATVVGSVRQVEQMNPATGRTEFRAPKIVSEEKPPTNHEVAIDRWKTARRRFKDAAEKSRKWQHWLESVRGDVSKLPLATAAEATALEALTRAIDQDRIASQAQRDAHDAHLAALAQFQTAQDKLTAWKAPKPGFWARLFRTTAARAWRAQRNLLSATKDRAQSDVETNDRALRDAANKLNETNRLVQQEESRWNEAKAERAALEKRLNEASEKFGCVLGNRAFYAQKREHKHRATLWFPESAQCVRDDLFIAAVALHRAFIDAAAKPLRQNLGAQMYILFGQSLPGAAKEALLPDLWATLFLVVPLISTTFASVGRMLKKLPPESLGWLFVDEAGQAAPQAAVGALMRSRRAIIVGDPVQIEPVVILPESLTHSICRRFGVDPEQFAAPGASVQTLADAASAFASDYPTNSGIRTVGAPLLVHRRCDEPMFSVSNATAYAGLMVQAKPPRPSAIRDALGPSAWIHVQSAAEDKWSEQEGREALRLLEILAQGKIAPNLYIVTPFVIVAEQLRQLVRESGVLEILAPEEEAWKWTAEHIGTVHTVQGREAEAVIFVLGAPSPLQSGARRWAGGRPNLLNVAVTRAKEVLYVIGNRHLWREAGHFRDLHLRLP